MCFESLRESHRVSDGMRTCAIVCVPLMQLSVFIVICITLAAPGRLGAPPATTMAHTVYLPAISLKKPDVSC